jgi:hypothetical protein
LGGEHAARACRRVVIDGEESCGGGFDRAAVVERDLVQAGVDRSLERERCRLRRRVERHAGLGRAIELRRGDVEVERIERDRVGRPLHLDVDQGAAGEGERPGVGRDADLVVHRRHAARQAAGQ